MPQDKLDKLPLVPIDWANHFFYGFMGWAVLVGFSPLVGHFNFMRLSVRMMLVVLAFGAGKKIYDYFNEHESVAVCVGKTLVTALGPMIVCALWHLG